MLYYMLKYDTINLIYRSKVTRGIETDEKEDAVFGSIISIDLCTWRMWNFDV